MDALLLMAPTATATGYTGRGDFSIAADGRLRRRGEREVVPFVYAGAAILHAGVLRRRRAAGRSSMSPLFDRAAEAGRLHGLRLDGIWMHVGTPDAVGRRRSRKTARQRCVGGRIAIRCRMHAALSQSRMADRRPPRVFTIPARRRSCRR